MKSAFFLAAFCVSFSIGAYGFAFFALSDGVFTPIDQATNYMDLTPTSSGVLPLHLQSAHPNEDVNIQTFRRDLGTITPWTQIGVFTPKTDSVRVYKDMHYGGPGGKWTAGEYKMEFRFNYSETRKITITFKIVDSTP